MNEMNEIETALYEAMKRNILVAEIIPQFEVGPYRIDFAVFSTIESHVVPEVVIGVEVDGYEFHERRIGAAIADRQRDREILFGGGIPILRFMGSEVHHNADDCAVEVNLALLRAHVGVKRLDPFSVTVLDPNRMLRDSKLNKWHRQQEGKP